MITKNELNDLKKVIQQLYLSDSLPWVIGYSGGKDSTATLQLLWMALSEMSRDQLNKKVHVINTDTLVESPIVSGWVNHSLSLMQQAIDEQDLPFVIHQLTPEYKDSFWVNLLGKGYPVPRRNLRWCTDRLKIKPVNTFIKQKLAEHGEIIMVLGTRKAESSNRNRMMTKLEQQRVRELLSPNPTLKNEYVFSPLEDWSNDDVWSFLFMNKNPWGLPNTDLMTLYRGATEDGECPIIQDKSTPSCGNSRFGCWVCTVVSEDKSLSAMIDNDEGKLWLKPMLEFRNEFSDLQNDRSRRSFRKMQGNLQGYYQKLNHGPYRKEYREKWLSELLKIQTDIQKNGPEEYRNLQLISREELKLIRKIWVYEKHEFEDSLPDIYKNATGEDWMDPEWFAPEGFGKEEWDLLSETCEDEHPEEELLIEMMSGLIDVESRASKNNDRKGLIDNLEQIIESTFYKDEEDALNYYRMKEERKRDQGIPYNERFFQEKKSGKAGNGEEGLDEI